ncbi:hypothetical protein GCM10011507_18590 [Edaphobacter acidisoli]|uniref:SGNH/GDSL hydrolase family protein n=1 Tax=Edaphobacter acidisoli TaxID=2040573 RepID=A0A916RUX0_9BACT|nr:SGNH/GDSL hydrolase family protein [Edaphobacter acidisoli]GGA67352.1 hypothetical protein GCM10011507_18590 [Edaphobacter acidisoli]
MNLYPHHSSSFYNRYNTALCFAGVLIAWFACSAVVAQAQKQTSIPEEIEWTWEVRPSHPNASLPNVLLLGDSLTRNYFPEVAKDLNDVANVYLMASSTSVGDPRLPHQIAEFAAMEHVRFRVIHFNNGMHGWDFTEAQYRAAFPDLLHSVEALAPDHNSLIWATITPVQAHTFNGATNERIDARNRIALAQIRAAKIKVDDQHELMEKHLDTYQDTVHFGPAGAALMGDQAAKTIRETLHP